MPDKKPLVYRIEETSTSLCFTKGRAFLASISVGNENSVGRVTVFDGIDAKGIKRLTMTFVANDSKCFDYSIPLSFDHGIYVEITTGTASLSVQWAPVDTLIE